MEPRNPSHRGELKLPTNVGVSETEKAQLRNKWNTFDQVREEIAKRGFVNPDKPEFECPQVKPEHLTTPDSKEYSTTYAQLLAWFTYTSPILAEVRSRLLQAENQMTIISSRIRRNLRELNKNKAMRDPDRIPADAIDDEINQDPDYQFWMLEAQKWKQEKIMLEAFQANIDESRKVVSRQVEIRKQEFEGTRVESNMPFRGRAGSGALGPTR